MAQSQEENGRVAQRRRTRRAIVDAATRLLADGGSPSVDEVAAAADVSRRTVYVHFPTFDQLLLDATLGALTEVEEVSEPAGGGESPWTDAQDAADRATGLVRQVLEQSPRTLPLGRQILRLTVETPLKDPEFRRGYRRMSWIDQALEPLRAQLNDEQHARLRSAVAVLVGFESQVVMRDVVGADADAELAAMTWAVRALVEAVRAEA